MWNNQHSSGNRDWSLFIWIGAIVAGMLAFVLIIGPNLSDLFGNTAVPRPIQAPGQATPTPLPDCNGWPDYQTELIKPGDTIQGPASIVPSPYALVPELGNILHLEVSHQNGWGVNVHAGQSVQLPASITLSDGQVWNVRGEVLRYASEAILEKNQRCWLIPIFVQ